MGLSRNKVAVSEGAAGSPPFYGDTDTFSRVYRIVSRLNVMSKRSTVKAECFEVRCSIFSDRKKPQNGGVAQLGEHLPCKQGVMGSNPIISTNGKKAVRNRRERRDTSK